MRQLIHDFPMQLQEAMTIGQSYQFLAEQKEFTNVVLTGLGGSGIGGTIAQNYVADKLKVPFVVNKDYTLPKFVDERTLVIVSSYSGNTEETVASLQLAIKSKATIVCVTAGGKIAQMAKKKNLDCIMLPSDMPPRACLGYSMLQILYVLRHFGMLSVNFEKEIKASIQLLEEESRDIQKRAKAIAKKLVDKTPIIYAAAPYEGVAVRFRQQINENGKMLAWQNPIPEMNHNELVGWRDKDASRAVVILRNDDDYKRTQLRMEINKKIIKKYTSTIIEIQSKGKSYWEKAFYLIHLTDYISVDLADLRGHDAVEVNVIDYLKGELANA